MEDDQSKQNKEDEEKLRQIQTKKARNKCKIGNKYF